MRASRRYWKSWGSIFTIYRRKYALVRTEDDRLEVEVLKEPCADDVIMADTHSSESYGANRPTHYGRFRSSRTSTLLRLIRHLPPSRKYIRHYHNAPDYH